MTTISLRMDDQMKKELDEMCEAMGMNISPFYMIYTKEALRDRADRSGFLVWPAVPSVASPGLCDESAGDDDRVRELDERVDHADADLGADVELAETAVVPGVRTLDHPPAVGLERFAFPADLPVAAERVEEIASLPRVVTGIEMHGDLRREIEAEPGELLQGRGE